MSWVALDVNMVQHEIDLGHKQTRTVTINKRQKAVSMACTKSLLIGQSCKLKWVVQVSERNRTHLFRRAAGRHSFHSHFYDFRCPIICDLDFLLLMLRFLPPQPSPP